MFPHSKRVPFSFLILFNFQGPALPCGVAYLLYQIFASLSSPFSDIFSLPSLFPPAGLPPFLSRPFGPGPCGQLCYITTSFLLLSTPFFDFFWVFSNFYFLRQISRFWPARRAAAKMRFRGCFPGFWGILWFSNTLLALRYTYKYMVSVPPEWSASGFEAASWLLTLKSINHITTIQLKRKLRKWKND